MRFLLMIAVFLLVCCTSQNNQVVKDTDWYKDRTLSLLEHPYYKATCTGVITGKNEFTTVKHCAKNEWNYLTHQDWKANKVTKVGVLDKCADVTPGPNLHEDGFCTYQTADDFSVWSERSSHECDRNVTIIHNGHGYSWGVVNTIVYNRTPHWIGFAWTNYVPASSGSPIWCEDKLVGVVALSGWGLTFEE
jgi:hypothetical protein